LHTNGRSGRGLRGIRARISVMKASVMGSSVRGHTMDDADGEHLARTHALSGADSTFNPSSPTLLMQRGGHYGLRGPALALTVPAKRLTGRAKAQADIRWEQGRLASPHHSHASRAGARLFALPCTYTEAPGTPCNALRTHQRRGAMSADRRSDRPG
jgi:hypothetical protein